LAVSTLRIGLAILGFVLLLFALGQAVGFDLLGTVVDALTSRIGRWLVVAFFALLIIAVAAWGFDGWTE
jgi:Na+-transporting NADH:ubiquinone oxidoreductase subunit NqrD